MWARSGRRSRWSERSREVRELRDQRSAEELRRITELLDDMNTRIGRLEEERDFYRELMSSETSFKRVAPGGPEIASGEVRHQEMQ